MEAHPGMLLPSLTPQQAAVMQQGLQELAQMRRKGCQARKHHCSTVTVPVSLEKMNAGCIKTVTRDRWRVDSCGKACKDSKTFHLVLARGSPPGRRQVLEGEGDEGVDTLPGDLVLVVQQKLHARFRRSGVPIRVVSRCCCHAPVTWPHWFLGGHIRFQPPSSLCCTRCKEVF
ncbi:hypothetical protein ABBQ32_006715 [Trebouxia sp. C0010 RCD-2024]